MLAAASLAIYVWHQIAQKRAKRLVMAIAVAVAKPAATLNSHSTLILMEPR